MVEPGFTSYHMLHMIVLRSKLFLKLFSNWAVMRMILAEGHPRDVITMTPTGPMSRMDR
jgi:hypothetical protein